MSASPHRQVPRNAESLSPALDRNEASRQNYAPLARSSPLLPGNRPAQASSRCDDDTPKEPAICSLRKNASFPSDALLTPTVDAKMLATPRCVQLTSFKVPPIRVPECDLPLLVGIQTITVQDPSHALPVGASPKDLRSVTAPKECICPDCGHDSIEQHLYAWVGVLLSLQC
jgi:hypothetical protein